MYLSLMKNTLLPQLKVYELSNKSVSTYLENDIKGYELIIKSGVEDNAKNFIKIKDKRRINGDRLKDNLAVIDYMKKNNIWIKR